MSLFPAYSIELSAQKHRNNENEAEPKESVPVSSNPQWLENNSFAIKQQDQLKQTQCNVINVGNVDVKSDTATNSPASLNDLVHGECVKSEITLKKHKKAKKKAKKKNKTKDKVRSKEKTNDSLVNLEFTGEEAFYIDKNKAKVYNTITTLHRPACPKYKRAIFLPLGQETNDCVRLHGQRYFNSKVLQNDKLHDESYALEETEYTTLLGELNRKTVESCKEIALWLEIVQLQDRNPYKWSRLKISEKKIDYIQKALQYNPHNEKLYRLYIAIISATYPSHDVTKMLEKLLNKDPYCFTLWQAQIMTTQGTMASCTIPKVLALYQRCMRKMYNSHKEDSCTTSSDFHAKDSVILRLFHNCLLFLRQAGLFEQFFALIKLSIQLNVTNTEDLCNDLIPRPEDEKTLIEYEEVILQSGLPMNEIWLRIEKLRQSFNFLPIPVGNKNNCSDPQRIVFNEDICHYVYPLKSKDNTFRLILIILKLLKIPFIGTHSLCQQFEGNTDAIEELLICCIPCSYMIMPTYSQHDLPYSIYELVKELCVSPTFLNHNIAHELYVRCLRNFIMNCAATYNHNEYGNDYDDDGDVDENDDKKKRLALPLLWCRFERLLLITETLSNKVTAEYIKNGQRRFKLMLKEKQNRNIYYLYVEFALYEIEAKSHRANIEKIFINILTNHEVGRNAKNTTNTENRFNKELLYVYVVYAEILIGWHDVAKASQLLSAYFLDLKIISNGNGFDTTAPVSDVCKLLALKKAHKKLEETIHIEANADEMCLERYLLPDSTVLLLKAYILLQIAFQQNQQVINCLEDLLLTKFLKNTQNVRHLFLREQIYELYLNIMQLPNYNNKWNWNNNYYIGRTITQALQEYPHNVHFMYQFGKHSITTVWFKVQSELLRAKDLSVMSLMFTIALIRYRYMKLIIKSSQVTNDGYLKELTNTLQHDMECQAIMIRHRILNLFQMLLTKNFNNTSNSFDTTDSPLNITLSLKRNSLFWRCYLRCLSDQTTAFETSRNCLLTALDECPWSKALYMDGVMYVPQELPHLQDLIIEKQLRIYALPEELEILREN